MGVNMTKNRDHAATTDETDPALPFPRLLRQAWSLSEAASQGERRCDAQDRPTMHRRLMTRVGPYWICRECGQMHREHVDDDLEAQYDKHWHEKLEDYQPSEREIGECRRWVRRIAPYRKHGRLFEVGCGLGLMLKTAREDGWEVEGNELSSTAAAHAARFSGGRVHVGRVEDIDLDPQSFDVVLLNNVFEHLFEPGRSLVSLAAAMRPGGVMFFQTLNGQSLSLYFHPTHWLYFGRMHLFVPTLISMKHYFDRAGLAPIRFETHGYRSAVKKQRKSVRDRLLSLLAGRIGRGHRVKVLLEKKF